MTTNNAPSAWPQQLFADNPVRFGVIGGSGLYAMEDIEDVTEVTVPTPFGDPSDNVIVGTLHGVRVAFIPRHGRGHRFTPSEVPYRANVWALKALGAEYVLSVSAVGSMQENIEPGHLVIVDQFIDRTVGRERTFFGDGVVGHLGFSDPVCETFRQVVFDAAKKTKAPAVHDKGTYVCIEGPTFSTRAESLLFRSWGVNVIGMTNLPEARLVREAEMSYATIALATDYDCWHEGEDDVSVEAVVATLKQNVSNAQDAIRHVAAAVKAGALPDVSPQRGAGKFAVMTDKSAIPPEGKRRLQLMYRDVLG